jgi:hypothetical protein
MKNLTKLITGLAFIVMASFMIASSYHNSVDASIDTGAATAILTLIGIAASAGVPKGVALTSITVSEMASALGDYCRKFSNKLISEILLADDVTQNFTVYDNIKDELALPNMSITDIVKPMDYTSFDPSTDALKFGARVLKVRDWKVDLLLYPKILEKQWTGLMNQKGSDPLQLPFEQYIMDYIIRKAQDNLRFNSYFQGIYNGVGTTPTDVMDGFIYLISSEADGGGLDPVSTGASSSSTIVDDLLKVYDNLGEAYKAVPTQCFLSPTMFDWYVRKTFVLTNSQLTSGSNLTQAGLVNRVPLVGTNCTLIREPGMGTSKLIAISPKENWAYGCDSMTDVETIRVQQFERSLKIMIDGKSGVQFNEVRNDSQGNIPLSVNDQVIVIS